MSPPSPPARHLRHELALGLLVGTVFALAAAAWLAPFHLSGGTSADDLWDYCAAVLSLDTGDPSLWPENRARLPGLLPALLRPRLGVFDSLLLGAVAGTGLMGAGLYLWGRALGGRLAGVATAAAALTMGPLVLQARMPSFYPAVNGALALATGLTALAVVSGRPRHHLAAGVGIGLALLVDTRALVWALPLLGTAGLAAAAVRGPRGPRLLGLLLPLVVSYGLGRWSFPVDALSLEQQLDVRPLFHLHGSRAPEVLPPWDQDSRFVWGHTPPWGIPATLLSLARSARLAAPADLDMPTPPGFFDHQVWPWLAATRWLALPAGVLVALRGRWRLVALVGTATPYLVALWGLQHMVEAQARFLTQGLPVVALLMGIAFAGGVGRLPAPGRWGPRARAVLAVGLLTAVVTGALPTRLSPVAGWRLRFAPELRELAEIGVELRRAPAAGRLAGPPKVCAEALRAEHAAGHPRWSRWVVVTLP